MSLNVRHVVSFSPSFSGARIHTSLDVFWRKQSSRLIIFTLRFENGSIAHAVCAASAAATACWTSKIVDSGTLVINFCEAWEFLV